MSVLSSRVRYAKYLDRLAKPHEVVKWFKHGDTVAWSGFTPVGSPKVVPEALADYVEQNNLQGKLQFDLFVGASSVEHIENRWAQLGMISRRTPYQSGKQIAGGINTGRIRFIDVHLSMWPLNMMYGFYTTPNNSNRLDVAVVEATAITDDGMIVPAGAVGGMPEMLMLADKVIIELNTAVRSFEGMHDILVPQLPPYSQPFFLTKVSDRIGMPYVSVDPAKVVAIVESKVADVTGPNTPEDAKSRAIAGHLVDFLEHEVSSGRIPKNLHPLQSGVGNICNAVIAGLANSKFEDLTVWTEVLQDSFLDFFDSGKLTHASSTSIKFSPKAFDQFYSRWDEYKDKITLRPQHISNHPELVRRLGLIAMNTPVEVDIYGHANSSNVLGSRIINGIGGSGDFLRNSKLSIIHTPSTRNDNKLSCIVPFVSHVDHTEHDLDVIVTEQGLADLRGLAPRERARLIIAKCAHPEYKPLLSEYLDIAESLALRTGAGHEPHSLRHAFKMYINYEDSGTMKLSSWH
ncbi:hypothetical protein V1512DRAFT_257534 [Lipomyces arxii]|uniref:uncharacterized protein n=1 Tax=Lipomyces arxii TaxID=56418 RepID=UPI0034CD5046